MFVFTKKRRRTDTDENSAQLSHRLTEITQ